LSWNAGPRWRRDARRTFGRAIFGVLLHASELTLKLLVTILQLLDGARELSDLRFQTIETHGEVARRLRHPPAPIGGVSGRVIGRPVAVAEQLIQETAPVLLRCRDAGAEQQREKRKSNRPMRKASHWRYECLWLQSQWT
jgi:hypothetical protein